MKKLLAVYFFWLAILLIVGAVSPSLSHWEGNDRCGNKFSPTYFRWDSAWYTQIAEKGYSYNPGYNSTIAYWPLYPATIRIFHELTGVRYGWVAYYLSIVYSFLAVLVIYKLIRIDYGEKESFDFMLIWLLWPASYYLIAVYPESLFVLLTALSLYLARKKKWLLTGMMAGLLALTKPYGALIVPALFWEYIISEGGRWKILFKKINWLPLLLPVVSVFGFVYFNWIKFGNAWAFWVDEGTWGRSFSNPISALMAEAQHYLFAGHILSSYNFPYLIYLASFTLSIVAFVMSWKKVRKSYLLFSFLVLALALYSGTLTSWYRYMFMTFPIFIGPTLYLSDKKNLKLAYLAVSIIFLIVIASLFVRCFPVV